jgi:hypothetical protein
LTLRRANGKESFTMRPLSVLVVVNRPQIRSLFADMVPLLNMKVEFAATGLEACTRLATLVPDIVVFDLCLISDGDRSDFDLYQREDRFMTTRFVGLSCEPRVHDLGFRGANNALLAPFLHAVAEIEQLLPYTSVHRAGGTKPLASAGL